MPNYWGFRIDTNCPQYPHYYNDQLENHGILRQGWGYEENHDLRQQPRLPDGEYDWGRIHRDLHANIRMYEEVKKDDIILIPRIPEWPFVTIAEATKDWKTGYEFEIDAEMNDYGHIFPARYLKHFSRNNENVRSNVRSTLRCRSRFWSMNPHKNSLQMLVELDCDLTSDEDRTDRFRRTVFDVIKPMNPNIEGAIHEKMNSQFKAEEWEYPLVAGLEVLFPNYQVERTGGSGEQEHGTDILITIPGPLENVQYGIAIQVKDWRGEVAPQDINEAIEKLKLADEGWPKMKSDLRIIEKILVVTDTEVPVEQENNSDVTIIDAPSLKRLLRRMVLAIAVQEGDD